jgi:glutamate 5-kinase
MKSSVRRLVVKVGTRLLTRAQTARLDGRMIGRVAGECADARRAGAEVLLVSSGAVAAGMGALGLRSRPRDLPRLQAAAAVGQGLLIDAYRAAFRREGIEVAQVLLTHDDLADRRRHVNARRAIETLLRMGVVPIANENDTVSVDELRFGDNDTLAALVATLVGADLLVILTDVDGLYVGKGAARRRLAVVPEITPDVETAAGGPGGATSLGGMKTKVAAARTAGAAGIPTVLASGRRHGVVARILAGDEIGTTFVAGERIDARRRWIAGHVRPRGRIVVDEGAARALRAGRSLLPVGVVSVEGAFQIRDCVEIVGPDGRAVARGLARYAAAEIRRAAGRRTDAAGGVGEVVHRDDLAIL